MPQFDTGKEDFIALSCPRRAVSLSLVFLCHVEERNISEKCKRSKFNVSFTEPPEGVESL